MEWNTIGTSAHPTATVAPVVSETSPQVTERGFSVVDTANFTEGELLIKNFNLTIIELVDKRQSEFNLI